MKNKKIHNLTLLDSSIENWLKTSNYLEEELSINEDFLFRLINSRFVIPLYKESFVSVTDSKGDAVPVMLFKSDYTPFVPVYTSISKAKTALKTKNIVSNDFYRDLLYRSLCPFDVIDILENNDIYEINLNPDEWCVSSLHLKKERISSWKKILESTLKKFNKEKLLDISFDDIPEDNLELVKSNKNIKHCYVEKYKVDKNIDKYVYYFFTKEDPFYLFNEYAQLIEELNELNNSKGRDVFIEIIGHFESDHKNVDLSKAIQLKTDKKSI